MCGDKYMGITVDGVTVNDDSTGDAFFAYVAEEKKNTEGVERLYNSSKGLEDVE